ncbi:MAG: tetratricopeptide repeat protein [Myxococcota bacterium]
MHRSLPLGRSLAILVALLALAAPVARAAEPVPWTGPDVLDDPQWRKHFLGSYGFLSGAEPQPSATELELLREVIEVMKANPQAAAKMLEGQVGDGSSAALDFVLANLQFQSGAHDAALANYERAIAKFPDFRRAHKNLGLLYVQKGHAWPKAVEHLSRAVELGDRDGRNFGLLGFAHLNLENFLAAEEAYRQAVLAEPSVRDWKLGLARALLSMEKYAEAVSIFDMLIAENPEDASAWMGQANAYIGLEKPEAAAVNLEAVRMMGKAQTSSLVLLGDIYMNAGNTELAKDAYLEVIRSDATGGSFETAVRAADLLLRTRAYDAAGDVLRTIDGRYAGLARDDELQVLTLKAKLARATGRKQEAAKLLESVVERDGTRGDALIELASFHASQGNTAKALFLLERAESLDAYAYPALLEHAQLLVGEKDYAKAAELLRRALQLRSEPRVERFLALVEESIRP